MLQILALLNRKSSFEVVGVEPFNSTKYLYISLYTAHLFVNVFSNRVCFIRLSEEVKIGLFQLVYLSGSFNNLFNKF